MNFVVLGLCLILIGVNGSFIKGKNVPRIGRSNEADGQFDHTMGYVIKTIPSKSIPRMGRRSHNPDNIYDIPKLPYQQPIETYEDATYDFNQESMPEDIPIFYDNRMNK